MLNIGSFCRQSDGGIFAKSCFGRALAANTLGLTFERACGSTVPPLPYVFIGDEAFPLQIHMMRPYPGKGLSRQKRIFNYRLSRARRVVENAFGILTQRFRIFQKPIAISVDRVDDIIKAACCLHNFLLRGGNNTPFNETGDGAPCCTLNSMGSTGRNASTAALTARDVFADYFAGEGAVPWQDNLC